MTTRVEFKITENFKKTKKNTKKKTDFFPWVSKNWKRGKMEKRPKIII